jgi:RNA polymerase sigma-70 factor, ECF subfamily
MVALKIPAIPPAAMNAQVDAELVRRYNSGDEAAFVEIISRYYTKMQQIAMNLLHNRADAEEITQDTFIRAHRGLARFRGDSSLATWLYRITVNLSRNRYWYYFRRRRAGSLPLDASVSEGNTASFADIIASDEPSPLHEAVTSEFAVIVSRCMNLLPASQRQILTMRNEQHHSYFDISRKLGIEIGTVKSRIARARASLRLLLGQSYPEYLGTESPFTCFEPAGFSGILRAVGA